MKASEYNLVVSNNIYNQMNCLKQWNLPSKRKQAIELGESLMRVDKREKPDLSFGMYQLKTTIK
jgi:hypothetical protein